MKCDAEEGFSDAVSADLVAIREVKNGVLEETNAGYVDKTVEVSIVDPATGDASYRLRLFKTLGMAFSALVVFASFTVLGSYLTELEYLFGLDTSTVALAPTAASCGFFLGTALTAFVASRVNPEFALTISISVCGICCMAAPRFSSFTPFITIIVLQFIGLGHLTATRGPYTAQQWVDPKTRASFLQLVFCADSTGYGVGPQLVTLFVQNIKTYKQRVLGDLVTSVNATSLVNQTLFLTNMTEATFPAGKDEYISIQIQNGFLVVGAIVMLAAVVFFILFLVDKLCNAKTILLKTEDNSLDEEIQRPRTEPLAICYMVLTTLHFGILNGSYNLNAYFFQFFITKGLQLEPWKGTTMMTAFFIGLTVGRASAILVSRVLKAHYIWLGSNAISCICYFAMCLSYYLPEGAVWAVIIINGIATGPLYGALVTHVSRFVSYDGLLSGAMEAFGAVMIVALPPLIGFLMTGLDPVYFCYIVAGGYCIGMCVAVGMMVLTHRRYIEGEGWK